MRGPAGGFEFGVFHALAGGVFGAGGNFPFSRADGRREVVTATGMIIDSVVESGEVVRANVKEGAGGVVAVDQVDEGVGGAEGQGLVGAGGFDESGAAGSVNSAEADSSTAGFDRQFFGGHKDIARRGSAHRGGLVDFRSIVLRINRCAAGEDGELRFQDFDQIAQRFEVNDAVSLGVASVFPAQAVHEDIGRRAIAEFGAELFTIGGIGNKDAVRFSGQALGRFFRGNERGDLPSGRIKKIRASFTGVTATGEEDARS